LGDETKPPARRIQVKKFGAAPGPLANGGGPVLTDGLALVHWSASL